MPDGYDLQLACTACGLKKLIEGFPEAAAFRLGQVLDDRHQQVFVRGCLRCGVCRFTVMSVPPRVAREPADLSFMRMPGDIR